MFNQTGYGSAAINGQLLPIIQNQSVNPGPGYAPLLSGNAAQPPTIGGVGSTENAQSVQVAASNPLSFVASPVPLLLVMLVGGLAILRYIHWS